MKKSIITDTIVNRVKLLNEKFLCTGKMYSVGFYIVICFYFVICSPQKTFFKK